jgi:anti-sigma-K factor RskA
MSEPDLDPSDEDDVLAGEYVLGVLSLSERLSIEARMKVDTNFSRRIAQWENDLGAVNDGYADLKPPNLYPKIEARLFPKPPKVKDFSWFQFLLGSTAAAAIALSVFLTLPNPQGVSLVATLRADAQPLVFAARFDGQALILSQTAGPVPAADKVYQLWLIDGDAAPVSLGLIRGRVVRRPVAGLSDGMILAVSLEPSGGSPTGAPTGPVLVTGVVDA